MGAKADVEIEILSPSFFFLPLATAESAKKTLTSQPSWRIYRQLPQFRRQRLDQDHLWSFLQQGDTSKMGQGSKLATNEKIHDFYPKIMKLGQLHLFISSQF